MICIPDVIRVQEGNPIGRSLADSAVTRQSDALICLPDQLQARIAIAFDDGGSIINGPIINNEQPPIFAGLRENRVYRRADEPLFVVQWYDNIEHQAGVVR